MDVDRLRTGEMIAGISGAALLILMFLPWFGVSVDPLSGVPDEALEQAEDLGFATGIDTEISESFNAWKSFEFIDFVLLVTAVVAIGTAVATATASTVALPVAASAITAGLGILSTVLIAYRILDPPGGTDRKIGVFLGLIAAAGVAWGGWALMREEGASFGDQVPGAGDPPPPPPPDAPPPAPAAGDPPPPSAPPPSSGPPPQGPAA